MKKTFKKRTMNIRKGTGPGTKTVRTARAAGHGGTAGTVVVAVILVAIRIFLR